MHAPSTAAGQTSTAPATRAAALAGPRGRRRAPVLGPVAGDPDPGGAAEVAAGAEVVAGAEVAAGADQCGDVVRWAAFCCVLVPVVLLVYGSSLGGATGTALGLASVTAACRALLRRSERGMRSEGGRGRRRGPEGP
ncbi:hypothetical protein ACFVJI_03550 [Streptomyces sp. NPDC127584]|uniref:hypothetical protein n=1 Tax=Streptomyces sp. NPDC127584 TaxID=3345403 RepID=UPI0036447DD2